MQAAGLKRMMHLGGGGIGLDMDVARRVIPYHPPVHLQPLSCASPSRLERMNSAHRKVVLSYLIRDMPCMLYSGRIRPLA